MYDDENELVDIEEVMETLNIGRNTVYSLLKSGNLEAFRIGRMWKIPRGSIEKFIKENACRKSQLSIK